MSNSYKRKLKESMAILNRIIDALGEFNGKYDKKFNMSKLLNYLKVPKVEISDVISVILNFQLKFGTIFKDHFLKVKTENDMVYMFAVDKSEVKLETLASFKEPQKEIILSKDHASLLKDLIYIFKHVKRGKGFDLKSNGNELANKIKALKSKHPYFFHKNGNGLVYPTNMAVNIGNNLSMYAKSNKNYDCYSIMNYKVKIN